MHSDAKALVSVIVPIYNTERFLRQALDSICNQSYKNLEIILIDDGSTDSSPAIIDEYAAKDPRVRPVHKKNEGYGAGCNLGLFLARGEWVSIVEPDDYLDLDMYKDMLAFASRFDEQLDIIKCPWTDIRDWDDPAKEQSYPAELQRYMQSSTHPFTISEQPRLIATHPAIWSALYRLSFLREHNIRFIEYPGAGWADNPFLIETMCQAQAIVYLNQRYYNYRTDLPGSTWNHKSADAVTRPFERWHTMLDIIERLHISNPEILKAHYIRGFDYCDGAIIDDGIDNPLVAQGVKSVFERMDKELVFNIPQLPLKRIRYFCSVTGNTMPSGIANRRRAYLLSEISRTARTQGIGRMLKLSFKHIMPKIPKKIDHSEAATQK